MPIVSRGATATVYCAVWHGDDQRHALLEGHVACLEAQTVPVEVVYVFDAGDEPPEGLPGTHAVAAEPLSIYEAWNVGTQLARTEYVGNLNLDDRYAPDALRLLTATAGANDADLVGGDWEIVHSQEATDAVDAIVPALDLPYVTGWPPAQGVVARLGSGTGERGTLGPATLWKRSLHERVPYPWRFEDGTPIRSIGDMVWWRVVQQALRGSIVRLPLVVGRYHSHPGDQAEFRVPPEQDKLGDGIRIGAYPLDDVEVRWAR